MSKLKLIYSFLFVLLISVSMFLLPSYLPKSEEKTKNLTKKITVDLLANVERLMTSKGRKLIQEELLNPLNDKLKLKPNAKMYSRCPSGLSYYVEKAPVSANPYFYCVLTNSKGCDSRIVCKFRMPLNESTIQIEEENQENEYVDSKSWVDAQDSQTLAWEKLQNSRY